LGLISGKCTTPLALSSDAKITKLMYCLFMNVTALNFKALPISERIEFVEDIWDSIAEETPSSLDLSDAERAELHRRFAAHQANPSSGVPWEQVRVGLW
jgi:putative addiction module component (TIGR02574 family)